jgi:hypothetical protein
VVPQSAAPPTQGKNVVLPSHAFAERLKKAKDQGRTAYQAELDKQAQDRGFANHAAMLQHLDTMRAAPKPRPNGQPNGGQQAQGADSAPTPPKNPKDRKAMQKYEQDLAKQRREAEKKDRENAELRKKARRAEDRANSIEARANLERIAASCGIVKLGQAIYLYTEHCQGKTVEELDKMDETAFFNGLRQTDPYLFNEVTVPATTGTAPAIPGSHAPRPAAAAAAAGSAGRVNTLNMTKQEWAEYKRKQGLTGSSAGLG